MGCRSSSCRSALSTDDPSVSASTPAPSALTISASSSPSCLSLPWPLPTDLAVGFPAAMGWLLLVLAVFCRILARMSAHFCGSILCLFAVTLRLFSKRFLLWSVDDTGPPSFLREPSLIGPRLLGLPIG